MSACISTQVLNATLKHLIWHAWMVIDDQSGGYITHVNQTKDYQMAHRLATSAGRMTLLVKHVEDIIPLRHRKP